MDRSTTSVPSVPALQPLMPFERLRAWWDRFAAAVAPSVGGSGADRRTARLVEELRGLLDESRTQRGGELSARARAEQIVAIYRRADLPQRDLQTAIVELQAARSDVELGRAEARLRLALNAPRATFLAQFNLLPDGVKFLVDLRSDLLKLLAHEPGLEVL